MYKELSDLTTYVVCKCDYSISENIYVHITILGYSTVL